MCSGLTAAVISVIGARTRRLAAALHHNICPDRSSIQHSTGGRELILGLQFLDLCLKSPLLSLSLSFSLCFLSGVSAF